MTAADVISLAPDAASVKAGEALASPRKWLALGSDASFLWGECQGSGKVPYQVCVELGTLAYACSCPSRKFPCKHVLGALLAHVNASTASGTPPEWVSEWHAKRSEKQQRSAARASAVAAGAAPEAGEAGAAPSKRAQTRERRVAAGVDECERWLGDLIRLGLAHARVQPASFWEGRAARLVDAQCPGIARRVRALAATVVSGVGWEERTLTALGEIALLCSAYGRLDTLAPELGADVRRAIGWTQTHDEIAARAFDIVTDTWLAVGIRTVDEERITARRTWLLGSHTRRSALYLQFAPKGAPIPDPLVAGSRFDATLIYLESAAPLRAIVTERGAGHNGAFVPEATSIDASLESFARALAGDPWLERFPFVLADVTPQLEHEAVWLVRDASSALPLAGGSPGLRALLALSGGSPLCVAGEWDGTAFVPLMAWSAGRAVALGS